MAQRVGHRGQLLEARSYVKLVVTASPVPASRVTLVTLFWLS